ncbi:MAG TPA: DUF1343 domain-containing protein [Acidobacteriaceae bacterium]
MGLLTNQTGLDSQGHRTIDILRTADPTIELTKLFSPEHGIFGAKDSETIGQEIDPTTGIHVTSLYGPKDSDKRPKPEDLKDLDAVVIDLQDAGVRFYTYESVLGYFIEAASCEATRSHPLQIVVLDRPALIGGLAVQGPISNTAPAYINYMPEPVRNGMTFGELAQYMRAEHPGTCPAHLIGRDFSPGNTARKINVGFSPGDMLSTSAAKPAGGSPGPQPLPSGGSRGLQAPESDVQNQGASASGLSPSSSAHLTVVPMQNWRRSDFYDQTGLPWINPSPNLRSIEAATLYPGVGMMDATNVSVGRGTDTPFEIFGAGVTPATKTTPAIPTWFDGHAVATYLTARHIPGVTFAPTTFPVAETSEKYPYHGQTIQGVRMTVTDRLALDSPELGIEILSALHHLYPTHFKLAQATNLVANTETMAALARDDDPRAIAATWAPALAAFKERRAKYLLYR